MTKILLIAGHGENMNGSFDSGATGFISKGEHKYYEQDFFPAVKKYLPDNSNVILFSEYNVFDHRDLATLTKKYGNDTIVVEMHYDGGDKAASGGHVIVHADFAPDKYDLAIRDVIKKHIGVRYSHKGNVGISGRTNLYNCNLAAKSGINYRLVELGFGSNENDSTKMVKNIDAIAKDFVEALLGKSKEVTETKKPAAQPVASKPVVNKPAAVKPTKTKFNLPTGVYKYRKNGKMRNGNDVLQIQLALSSIYFYPKKGAKNNGCDGWYGSDTANAVKRFQSVNGLSADGDYGDKTRAKLNSLANK